VGILLRNSPVPIKIKIGLDACKCQVVAHTGVQASTAKNMTRAGVYYSEKSYILWLSFYFLTEYSWIEMLHEIFITRSA